MQTPPLAGRVVPRQCQLTVMALPLPSVAVRRAMAPMASLALRGTATLQHTMPAHSMAQHAANNAQQLGQFTGIEGAVHMAVDRSSSRHAALVRSSVSEIHHCVGSNKSGLEQHIRLLCMTAPVHVIVLLS